MKALVDWLNGVLRFLAAQRDKLEDILNVVSKNGDDKIILRIGTSGMFFSTEWIVSKPFDYILFPYVMTVFPWYYGIPLLTLCNFLYCLGSVNFYDYIEADALVIEDIKSLRDYRGKSVWKKSLGWLLRKGGGFAFLVLAIKWDPAYAVIYFRESNKKYSGINNKKSWKVFLGSLPINMWWCIPAYFLGKFGLPIASSFWTSCGPLFAWFAIESITVFVLFCALWYWLIVNHRDNN
jgi:hypothetical protein